MNEIHITPEPSSDELHKAIGAPFASTDSRPIQIAYWTFIMSLIASMITAMLRGFDSPIVGFLCFAGFAYIVLYLLSQRHSEARWEAAYRAYTSTAESIVFTERGAVGQCTGMRTEYTWNAFKQVVELNGCYVLVLRNLAVICIPKRNIPEGSAEDFASLLRGNFLLAA